MNPPNKRRSRPSTASGSSSKELVLYQSKSVSRRTESQSRPSTAPAPVSSMKKPSLFQNKNGLRTRRRNTCVASSSSSKEVCLYNSSENFNDILVSLGAQTTTSNDEQELLGEVRELLDPNSQSNVELNGKVDLLRRRYQHAVKSELVNFCYGSSLGSIDNAELVSSGATPRSQDFVSTLMRIVEKDKQLGRIATDLVEDIESVELEKERMFRPSSRSRRDNPSTIEDMNAVVHKLRQSRDHVLDVLQKERKDLFADSASTGLMAPLKLKVQLGEAQKTSVRDETAKGLLRILDRLGCQVLEGQSIHQMLDVAKEKLATLKQDVTKLRLMHSEQSVLN